MGEKAVEQLLDTDKSSWELLKIAHHGSKYSSSQEFLELVRPRLGIISCAKENRYGHPHAELLERLEDLEILTVQVWQTGAVTADWDGKNTKVSFHYGKIMLE